MDGAQSWEDYAYGPYRYTRHPLYLGEFGAALGAGLLFGAWPFIGVAIVLIGAGYVSAVYEKREYREDALYVENAARTRAFGRRRCGALKEQRARVDSQRVDKYRVSYPDLLTFFVLIAAVILGVRSLV